MSDLRVLLLSGLPLGGLPLNSHKLNRKTSFWRQLQLLARFLPLEGIQGFLAGPLAEPDPPSFLRSGTTGENSGFSKYPAGLWSLDREGQEIRYSLPALVRQSGARAVLLLGYADQFPFLRQDWEWEIPLFLWAQCSHPPETRWIGPALPVPLTEKTRSFLAASGITEIGPNIPHGVDTATYHPLAPRARRRLRDRWGLEGCFVIGTVGANSRRKRFDRLIQSLALISQPDPRHIREQKSPSISHQNPPPYKRAFLLIKTDRSVSLDGIDLNALIREHGLQGQARIITGRLSDQELHHLYGLMDVYVNLSEWEGFGIPVIEAMACGVPVASQPIQGPGEIVPYQELMIPGGKAVRAGTSVLRQADPQETARVLLKAYYHPHLLIRLSHQGLKAARAGYDIRHIAHLWGNLIRERLRQNPD